MRTESCSRNIKYGLEVIRGTEGALAAKLAVVNLMVLEAGLESCPSLVIQLAIMLINVDSNDGEIGSKGISELNYGAIIICLIIAFALTMRIMSVFFSFLSISKVLLANRRQESDAMREHNKKDRSENIVDFNVKLTF